MSTATEGVTDDGGLRSQLASVAEAYRYLEMPVRRYVLLLVAPTGCFVLGSVLYGVFGGPPLFVTAPLVSLAVLLFGAVLIYPKLLQERRAGEIRQRFHLFLTHITVLSMTNIDRIEVFRNLSKVEEYEALADEMGHLVALVDTWNQSLEDACEVRSKQSPSPLLRDFLERLAYAIGGGQEIDEFLIDEQDSNIKQFVIRYESDIERLSVIADLYLSMILSATFVLVFAIIIPILISVQPATTIGAVAVMYLLVQGGFVYTIHNISPSDPVWHLEKTAEADHFKTMYVTGAIGMGGSVLSLLLVALMLSGSFGGLRTALPLPLWVAIPFTPLLLPGLMMRREEKRVIDRDDQFPAFIRALGAVESVKQTSTANVLADLRRKDFGALTEDIENLFRRLSMRIDPTTSWHHFAAETGSYLIHKFGDMYVVGRRMGGDPRELGRVISTNLSEALKVRQKRRQETVTLMGILYGATAASSFAFFVGVEVVKLLSKIADTIEFPNQSLSFLLNTSGYNIELVNYLLIGILVVNAAMSATMIKLSDRGHFISGMVHFVLLLWTAMLTAVITKTVVAQVSIL